MNIGLPHGLSLDPTGQSSHEALNVALNYPRASSTCIAHRILAH